MKKLYTLFLLLSAVALSAITAHAESLKLHVADPNAVKVDVSYTPVSLVAGENVISFDPNSYSTLHINAATGYKLVSVTGADESYGNIYVNSGYSAELYLGSYVDGREYTVTTLNYADIRTATATVKVTDSYSSVRAQRVGSTAIDLEGQVTTVSFDPESESQFQFSRTDGSELYSVKLNGTTVAPSYGVHYVNVKDGDNIEIQANYPDVDVAVVVTIPEDAKGAISSFRVDYQDVTGYLGDDFSVKAGSTIDISFNTQDYNVKSITVNDVVQSSTYLSYKVGVDPVFIDIDASPYGSLNFTLDVDDPSRLTVYPGQSSYGVEPYALVAGQNSLTVGERVGMIYLKATTGNYIESVTDGSGNELTLTYDCVTISEGMTVVVRTAEKVYDGKWVLFIDSTSYDHLWTTPSWSDEETREYNYIDNPGYNVIPFAKAANVQYLVTVSTKEAYYAYKNGELMENPYNSTSFYLQFLPEDGDVIKVYTTGTEPSRHAVSFTLSGDKAADFTVTTDILKKEDAWTTGLSVLPGTKVSLKAPDDAENLAVSLDGTPLEPDADGNYSFDASADHNVVITATTGILGVEADNADAAPAVIYNLQGVRVSSDAKSLPAGIYIIDGKKTSVR